MLPQNDPILALKATLDRTQLQLSKDTVRKIKTSMVIYICEFLTYQYASQVRDSIHERSSNASTLLSAANDLKFLVGTLKFLGNVGINLMDMIRTSRMHTFTEPELRMVYQNDPASFQGFADTLTTKLLVLNEQMERNANAIHGADSTGHLLNFGLSYLAFGKTGMVASSVASAVLEVADFVSDLRM